MITATKTTYDKYPAYKESGLEWLGEIPEHWGLNKLKFLGFLYSGLSGKKGDDFDKEKIDNMKPFIPFTNIFNNFYIDLEQFHYVRIDESENQNRVKKNDILFLMSSETLEDIGKNSIYLGENKEIYLNSFCKGFRITSIKLLPKFINYLLYSDTYRNYFSLEARGFTRINLKQEYVNNALVILPPIHEQEKIAEFLDEKTEKIDRAIAQKEKMIALLKERKQIIIQDLVTGKKVWNADKNTWTSPEKTKDSGVEWIGEIPEDWEVKRLKYVSDINLYSLSEDTPKAFSFNYVDIGSVSFENGIEKTEFIEFKNSPSRARRITKKDNTIISTVRTYLKAIDFITEEKSKYIYSTGFAVLEPKDLLPKFLFHFVRSNSFTEQVTVDSKGMSYPAINSTDLSKLLLAIPTINEQSLIVSQIETQSAKIDKAIDLQAQQIEKLKELKSTLIDSAVTGKIKVC